MISTSEKAFETVIEQALLAGGPDAPPEVQETPAPYDQPGITFVSGGYHKRRSKDYDPEQCLIPQDLFDFILATQPKMWDKLKKVHGGNVAEAQKRLRKRLAAEVKKRGTLDVLRKGIRLDGCRFTMAYFRPASGLNPEIQHHYQANHFSVLRQLHYQPHSPDKPNSGPSLDLGLFLNGLPIFTAELKNQLTGQRVGDAIRQYRQDRDPQEPLFAFGRCLAHFAVDNNSVYVTTHLQGAGTEFLPFNQGYANGAGNPPSATGFATAYLWVQLWARDSVLDLIQHFIHEYDLLDDKGNKTGERCLIFPRYHQLDAVRRLVQAAYEQGPAQRYLIQHSAGSGKSNSIAWLAHQLSVLHNAQDERVFNSIIVISDRRVIDKQLQRTVMQFQQVKGVVENIDKTSRQLKQALEDGKTIIVTTLQKFPVIVNSIHDLPGQRFAVLVDEAHSSQSGESTKSLKAVLTANSLEEAELADEAGGDDLEDRLLAEASQRRMPPNVSFFAFTATPKPKTLELFGHRQPDGSFAPFSLYAMRQAIEEGFILDVLQNYTTYKTYWNLLKTITEDPRYERQKAAYLLKSFVELHDHAISKKTGVIVEHLASQVIPQIKGQAKAMLVTRSRLHAVRYKLAVERYLKEKGYPFKVLVAFSGRVTDPQDGETYTEASMNGFSDKQTAETFKQNEYRLLIVANKFQTGFDQPLLHTMYVDKKLGGVNAVQTLSRLNRTHLDKAGVIVLDFANEAEIIQKAFQPYYDRTILTEATDPNLLYDLETRLENFYFYTGDDLDRFAGIYLGQQETTVALPQLHAVLDPVVERFKEVPAEEQADFRQALTEYVRLYAFLAQVAPFSDADLEKLYLFARLLRRKLPGSPDQLPLEIQQQIELESFRLAKTGQQDISLKRGQGKLTPRRPKEVQPLTVEEKDALSIIIEALNERYGFSDVSEEEVVTLQRIEAKADASPALRASAQVNTPDNFRLSFDNFVKERFQELLEDNFRLYKKIMDDSDFAQSLLDALFERYLRRLGTNGEALSGV